MKPTMALALSILFCLTAYAAANEVPADYGDALTMAARAEKPVLIEFYTDW